jgi:hypothetical protein
LDKINIKGIQKNASKNHMEAVMESAKFFNGKMVVVTGTKGKYYPDIYTEETDIECETMIKNNTILNKSLRWDKDRKKILVLFIPDNIKVLFDEIYFYNNKDIIKLI